MYDSLLRMTWKDFMTSEFFYKSNTSKHVIEIAGSELDPNDDSDSIYVLYFNVFTEELIVAIHRTTKDKDVSDWVEKNYVVTKKEGVDKDGIPYKEIVFVLKSLSEAL